MSRFINYIKNYNNVYINVYILTKMYHLTKLLVTRRKI